MAALVAQLFPEEGRSDRLPDVIWPAPDTAVDASSDGHLSAWLCHTVVGALGVDAVAINLDVDGVRLPVAASSVAAAVAERSEFTLGLGPGLDAMVMRQSVVADEQRLLRRWPQYQRRLSYDTPFRSVAAFPLCLSPSLLGGLDLYSVAPGGVEAVDQAAAAQLAEAICAMLVAVEPVARPDVLYGTPGPGWLHGAGVRERSDVWVAIGLITAIRGGDDSTALASMRAFAARRCIDIDAVTAGLLDRTVVPGDL